MIIFAYIMMIIVSFILAYLIIFLVNLTFITSFDLGDSPLTPSNNQIIYRVFHSRVTENKRTL